MTLAKAKLASSITFIVLASFTIITYVRQNMFIIQATGFSFQEKDLKTLLIKPHLHEMPFYLPLITLLKTLLKSMPCKMDENSDNFFNGLTKFGGKV
jgi:hypothetical protein